MALAGLFLIDNYFHCLLRIDLNTKADALASTANYLKGHGWVRGKGYQPGEPNFVAIQGWNDASVYQQAIAIMGKEIDGR